MRNSFILIAVLALILSSFSAAEVKITDQNVYSGNNKFWHEGAFQKSNYLDLEGTNSMNNDLNMSSNNISLGSGSIVSETSQGWTQALHVESSDITIGDGTGLWDINLKPGRSIDMFDDAGIFRFRILQNSNGDIRFNDVNQNRILQWDQSKSEWDIGSAISAKLDMNNNEIKNVGEIRDVKTNYDLQSWGGYTSESSGNYVFGPFSPSSGNSHYIEKIVYSGYHPHRYGQLRDANGNPVVEAIDCDSWGTDSGERGKDCVYKFEYPVEMNGDWDLRVVDYSDGSTRRYGLTAYGFEGPEGLYTRQGWSAGDHVTCSGDSWCTVDSYTVPSGNTLMLTGMSFSTRHTYSIVQIEDGSGNVIVEGTTLGDHDWGNSKIEFGRAKEVSSGTKVRLRVYNDDSNSRDVKAMTWGYLK